jgi:subtilisin family serine protease
MYPAAYSCVVGVTAINKNHRIYRRAIRGEHVDVAALGVNVFAASRENQFKRVSGTSFAAPFVAAFIASQCTRQGRGLWHGRLTCGI